MQFLYLNQFCLFERHHPVNLTPETKLILFCSVAINENYQIIQQIITIQNDPKNAKGTNKIFDKNVTLFGKYVWFSQLLSPLSQNDVHEQLNNTIKPLKVAYTHSQMRHNLQTPSIHIHKTHNCLSSGYTAKQQR